MIVTGSKTGRTGQLCESLLPRVTSATKAANPKNRWPLMLERNKEDICQGPGNRNSLSLRLYVVRECHRGLKLNLNYLL